MKKISKWIPALFLSLGIFFSCSEEKNVIEDDNVEVSFELNLSDVMTRALVDQPATDDDTDLACPEPDDTGSWFVDGKYSAHIELMIDGNLKIYEPVKLIRKPDGKIVTDNLMIKKGNHTLEKMFIYVSDATDDYVNKVIYSSVRTGTKYQSHVLPEHLLPQTLVIETAKKPIIPVSLLCAVYDEAPDFGFSIWGLNFVKVYCLNYVVNIAEDPCISNSQDVVGASEIELIKVVKHDDGTDYSMTHTGSSSNGNIGTICFNDQGNIPDENENYVINIYIPNKTTPKVIITGNVSLAQLMGYKCSGFWQTPEGGDAATEGVLHFNLYGADLTTAGTQIPYSDTDLTGCTTAPWVLKVAEAWDCPGSCLTDCYPSGTAFLSDFDDFSFVNCPGLCDWVVCGFKREPHNKSLSALWGYLKTPNYKMNAGDKFVLDMESYDHNICKDYKNIVSVNLINVEDPTNPVKTVLEIKEVSTSRGEFTYTVPTAGCYRIELVVLNNCANPLRGILIYDMTYVPKP